MLLASFTELAPGHPAYLVLECTVWRCKIVLTCHSSSSTRSESPILGLMCAMHVSYIEVSFMSIAARCNRLQTSHGLTHASITHDRAPSDEAKVCRHAQIANIVGRRGIRRNCRSAVHSLTALSFAWPPHHTRMATSHIKAL